MPSEPIRLLLIEDNPDLTRAIGDMFAHAGNPQFFLESVGRLIDGIKRLSAGGIDCILLDLALPDTDGLSTFTRLYNHAPDAPIVVLTALADEGIALKSIREGAQDYLLKNEMTRNTLIRSVRYAIERKRGEEARSRLAAIVESSQDAIIGLSLEGLIVSWNHGAERIFGHIFEEVIGRSCAMLVPAERPDDIPVILEKLKRDEYVKDFEAVRLRKDGQDFYVTVSVSPIKNMLGKLIGASMIARDIDERVQIQQEREVLIGQLQAALAQVSTLNGLLPICASCKKIRDDHGYWTAVEVYLSARSHAEFTHGICPDCAAQYRAGLKGKIS